MSVEGGGALCRSSPVQSRSVACCYRRLEDIAAAPAPAREVFAITEESLECPRVLSAGARMARVTELNPFEFSKPASADELIDREQDLDLLLRLVRGQPGADD